ncbi:MAG: hypothetical protein ABJE47_18105 [bacterium]
MNIDAFEVGKRRIKRMRGEYRRAGRPRGDHEIVEDLPTAAEIADKADVESGVDVDGMIAQERQVDGIQSERATVIFS